MTLDPDLNNKFLPPNIVLQPNWSSRSFALGIIAGSFIASVAGTLTIWASGLHFCHLP